MSDPPPHPPAPSVTPPAPGALPRAEAVELFLQRTRHVRTGSPHTLRAYRTDLRRLAAFLDRTGLDYLRLRRSAAERYLAEIAAESAPRTVRRRISCVRSFYRFLIQIEAATTNPFSALDLPSFDAKSETHKVWNAAEVERAVTALREDLLAARRAVAHAEPGRPRARTWGHLFLAARRRSVFVLMAVTGLRRGELIGLRAGSLVGTTNGFALRVTGKGSKTRTVPLSGAAYPALEDWLVVRRRVPTASDALFITQTGQPLLPKQLRRLLMKLNGRVRPQHAASPHTIRRTFASHRLAATGDIRAVQEVLGHASIATTQIYTYVDDAKLRQIVEADPFGRGEHARGPLLAR